MVKLYVYSNNSATFLSNCGMSNCCVQYFTQFPHSMQDDAGALCADVVAYNDDVACRGYIFSVL